LQRAPPRRCHRAQQSRLDEGAAEGLWGRARRCRALLALQPKSHYTLGTRCFALAGLGEPAAARESCAQAIALCGEDDCSIDRGMLAFLDGNYAEARRQWELAIAADPKMAQELASYLSRAQR